MKLRDISEENQYVYFVVVFGVYVFTVIANEHVHDYVPKRQLGEN